MARTRYPSKREETIVEIKNPEYILAIAQEKNLTRAAEKLYITQPALSQYLLKIEDELGLPLFIRSKGQLTPTEAGTIYLRGAQAVAHAQQMTQTELSALKNGGKLRMAVSTWGLGLMTDILPQIKRKFPLIELELIEQTYDEMWPLMRDGQIDLAISALTDEDDPPAQGAQLLYQEPAVLALPEDHPFCAAHPHDTAISWEAIGQSLRTTSFIFSDAGSTIRKMEDRLFRTLLFRPQIICELDRKDYMLKLVERGVGAALIPLSDAKGVPGVRVFLTSPPMLRRELLITRRGLQRSEACTYLQRVICDMAAEWDP